LMGVLQSPIICLILVASEKLYKPAEKVWALEVTLTPILTNHIFYLPRFYTCCVLRTKLQSLGW
jgi:hypothetical protein